MRYEMTGRLRLTGVALMTLIFIFLCGLITAAWYVFLSDTFRVKEIEIRGNAFLTDAEVNGMLEGLSIKGRHVWFTDFPEVATQLTGDPRIASASFERQFPDYICLTIKETNEFATVMLGDGNRFTIGHDGLVVRPLQEGQPNIGPLMCGFSESVIKSELPSADDIGLEKRAWSGSSSDPFIAGQVKAVNIGEERDKLREELRYQRALQLAEETWIDRNKDVSGYDYIGIDGNYDLFLAYPGRPPVVVGGFLEPYDIVSDLRKILAYDDAGLWGKYDYIDLHLPGYARGVDLKKVPKGPTMKWSSPAEAARVAAWKMSGEVDYRLKK
jgi:hypothetical protein